MGLTATLYNNNYKTGVNFDIRPGGVFRDEYNEVLDSGTIIISQRTTPIVISPFDVIVVSGTNFTTRRFAVDSVTERVVSFDPLTYDYQINLFSETKILENYVLPNLSITQPADISQRKSVRFYLEKYLEMYGPKIRVRGSPTSTWVWSSRFVFTNATLTFFDSVECPELQWNQPTLREVLNDLMMVKDRIPILRNNDISFLDITATGSAISTTNLNFVEKVITSNDGVTELRINMENALTPKKDDLDVVTRKVEFVGFRNSTSSAYISTENMEIVVDNPIYKLLRVTMFVPVLPWVDGPTTWAELDITNHCVEASIYNVLSSEPKGLGPPYNKVATDINRKQFNVFYQRGGNTISGWGTAVNVNNFLFLTWDEYPYDSILAYILGNENFLNTTNNFNRMDTVFRVEYETQASIVADIGRTYNVNLNERTTFDNQTNAYVDINAQGKFTQTKVNRLGNDVLMISGRYDNANAVPNLSQTYNTDYIIFSREVSVFEDFVLVKLMATKNYILRDYFTGVSSRKRNFSLDTQNSFIRHDLVKRYAEFSFQPKFEQPNNSYDFVPVTNLLGLDFTFARQQPILTAFIQTTDPNGSTRYPSLSSRYFGVDFDKKISGNSLLLTLNAKDSVSVGDAIVLKTVGGVANTRTQEPYFYANRLTGEFGSLRYFLADSYNVSDGVANFPVPGQYVYGSTATTVSALVGETRIKPEFNGLTSALSNADVKIALPMYKDNKEILRLTTQIEFCSDSRSIIFTEQFLKLQKYVREKDLPDVKFKVVGKSFFPYTSDYIRPAAIPGNELDASAFVGYSVPYVAVVGGVYNRFEAVSELNANGVPTWVSYTPNFQVTQVANGSAYTPIHKVGNNYGVWVGKEDGIYDTIVPFFVEFDGTGVWANANEDYIQLVITTIPSYANLAALKTAYNPVNYKGGMIVAIVGGVRGCYFSLPVATFQAGPPYAYTGQTWEWVDKGIVITNLLDTNRMYVLYSNNNTRYRWNSTSGGFFYAWTKKHPVGWNLYLGTTNAHLYNEYDTLPKGGTDSSGFDITLTSISASTVRMFVGSTTASVVSWGIVDENGKLIIAVNGNNFTIYLNLLNKRDTRVFSSRTSDVIVGSINNTTNSTYAV